MCEIIHSIEEYLQRVNKLIDGGHFTFRGQCDASWPLEPGIIRRIKITFTGIDQGGLLFCLSVDHTKELLEKARTNKFIDEHECDLNLLAILQHYGAATPLLDFTDNPLVALYFACQPYLKDNCETDGKVFCINYPNQIRSYNSPMRPVSNPAELTIDDVLGTGIHRGIWHWKTPRTLPCKRSEKQESVFVFGWGLYWKYNTDTLIDEMRILVISAEGKSRILKDLKDKYDISEQTLFPDIPGFSQSNSHDKVIHDFSAEDFYNTAEKYYWDGSPEWAAEYYKMAFTKKPDWIEARYKHALSLNWNGEQSEALESLKISIEYLGEKWQFLLSRAITNRVINKDWKTDFIKAKSLAIKEKQVKEFEQFIEQYGPELDQDIRL